MKIQRLLNISKKFTKINHNKHSRKPLLRHQLYCYKKYKTQAVPYIKKIFYLGKVCDDMEPLGGELASRSSTGEVQTGLLEANSKAYCRTSTKGNRLGPEP